MLLEERTKKGGWKARAVDGIMSGAIANSPKVPEGTEANCEVELFVQSPGARDAIFLWPSPDVVERFSKSKGTKPTKQHPAGRRRRKR